jgi:hypothetical protein
MVSANSGFCQYDERTENKEKRTKGIRKNKVQRTKNKGKKAKEQRTENKGRGRA